VVIGCPEPLSISHENVSGPSGSSVATGVGWESFKTVRLFGH
jgi:hypothetical protein